MNVYFIAVLLAAVSTSHPNATTLQPNQMHWIPVGAGMTKGIEIASLLGDINKPGPFAVRLRLPAGASWQPHYHNNRMNATVMSGELLIGFGSVVNRQKMVAYPAGSFLSIPPHTVYYDATKGGTVVQEFGQGPMLNILSR